MARCCSSLGATKDYKLVCIVYVYTIVLMVFGATTTTQAETARTVVVSLCFLDELV